MLSQAELEQRAGSKRARKARPLPSLRQRYQQYLFQRIEDYKNSLSREELLGLGNDAVAELQNDPEGQYFLTEVLMQDTVDKLIQKRLRLPSFARWREKFARLRQAQREPTHWGLERKSVLTAVVDRLEGGDHAVVIGGGAELAVYLLAAHEARLTCLFEDNATCTRIEARMAAESLTGDFEAFVVQLGHWFPPLPSPAHLVVIDAGTLANLSPPRRLALMARLQDWTVPGGLHAVTTQSDAVAPETWLSLYPDWERVPLRSDGRGRAGKRSISPGVLLSRPLPPKVSEQASTA
jgi:hypothetical protein